MTKMTPLERVEQNAGKILRFDNRYVVWTSTGTHDIRDIAAHTGLSVYDVHEAIAGVIEGEHTRRKSVNS